MYLHGVPFLIYTDHHNLQNFGTKALLNRRQARWAGLLAQYEFHIQFRPGKANGKADPLTRRSGDLPKEGDMHGRPFQEILNPTKFSSFSEPILCHTAIKYNSDIKTALTTDELTIEIAKALDTGKKQLTGRHSRSVPLGECIVENGLVYVYGLLYVPDNENLYQEILHAVAVLAIRTLISSVLLSHICTCFGLCNSLGGHICRDSYDGQLWAGEVIKGCWTAREIVSQLESRQQAISQLASHHSIYQLCST